MGSRFGLVHVRFGSIFNYYVCLFNIEVLVSACEGGSIVGLIFNWLNCQLRMTGCLLVESGFRLLSIIVKKKCRKDSAGQCNIV